MNQSAYFKFGNYSIGPVTLGDAPAFVEHLKDRAIYENTQGIPFPYTEADANQWIKHRVKSAESRQTLFAIRDAQSFLIGTIDAGSKFTIGRDHASEIGYWLAVPYWGKGIMPAAVKWLSEYAFSDLELTRLTAHVFSFNRRSARVLEKSGFQLEGILKKHHLKDGVFIDAHLYALVR